MTSTLLARAARPVTLKALESWEVGQLDLRLPDGASRRFGRSDGGPAVRLDVTREGFFAKLALRGDLGAGESYMDGDWSASDLPRFVELVLLNRDHLPLESRLTKLLNLGNDLWHRLRANTRRGSRRNIQGHYDLSNAFFEQFLDESMTYSSAVFEYRGQGLSEAQANKYRRLAEKAQLGPEDHVLEIGCGWGGFAIHAARSYGCRVTGITISREQFEMAQERVAAAQLQDRVEIRFQDYRDLEGRFDKVVSIEMFEALGLENWATFFRKCHQVLAPEGLVVIQTISIPDHRFDEYRKHCDWLQRYIFPGSLLASTAALAREMARNTPLGIFHLEDVGIHYAETLSRWRAAFLRQLPRVRELGFDERFIRMWDYYLAICQAAFATRTLGNLQLVLTRPNNTRLPGIAGRRLAAAS